jgi:hypoxanthine phosphoribosyltransferase
MSNHSPSIDVLFDEQTISKRVKEMGHRITADYGSKNLTCLVVLKGSFVFAADLIRTIDLPLSVEFIGLRSYGDRHETSGVVQITLDVKHPLENQNVLVIEDIVDTGLTLSYLRENLLTRRPASIKIASLLHKPSRVRVNVPIDYLGFTIPDKFVVGYGLDDAGIYRNLPYVGVVTDQ